MSEFGKHPNLKMLWFDVKVEEANITKMIQRLVTLLESYTNPGTVLACSLGPFFLDWTTPIFMYCLPYEKGYTVNVTFETLVLEKYFAGFLLGKILALCWEKPYFPNFYSLMLAKSLLYEILV